jgi:hypothetical protein
MTLLYGTSPAGLNATGESDIRLWYDNVHGREQNGKLRDPIEYLTELILASAEGPTGGQVTDDWALQFNSLFQQSDEEIATTRRTQADTDRAYIDTGVLTPAEVRESRFGGDAYSLETTLSPEGEGQLALLTGGAPPTNEGEGEGEGQQAEVESEGEDDPTTPTSSSERLEV